MMLFLMDVLMPRLDGLKATRAIREIYKDRATRPHIIAMTANALAGDRERCIEAGMDGYVTKPIIVAELNAALETAVEELRQRQSLQEQLTNTPSLPAIDYAQRLRQKANTSIKRRRGSNDVMFNDDG